MNFNWYFPFAAVDAVVAAVNVVAAAAVDLVAAAEVRSLYVGNKIAVALL